MAQSRWSLSALLFFFFFFSSSSFSPYDSLALPVFSTALPAPQQFLAPSTETFHPATSPITNHQSPGEAALHAQCMTSTDVRFCPTELLRSQDHRTDPATSEWRRRRPLLLYYSNLFVEKMITCNPRNLNLMHQSNFGFLIM